MPPNKDLLVSLECDYMYIERVDVVVIALIEGN